MPSKRVIVLSGAGLNYRVAYWLDVPVGRRPFYANPDKTSQWIGASQAETDALKDGSVSEEIEDLSLPPGATLAQIKTGLEGRWTARQALINSAAANNWTRSGTFLSSDGTTWTDVVIS